MYLTTVACKPHIVSKGKNWVMKEFGNDISKEYRGNNDSFNEFYFKKGICAAIIFRAVDNYLESHKDSEKRPTGFWYKVGGYKLNIVPYTIAKILSKIPDGYSLNWNAIWQKQALSPAFMHEIEIVTKQTNDFICDSHGMIVTEYCKKESTWEDYKADKTYTPSAAFMDELVPVSLIKEEETSAKKEAKESNDLKVVMGVVALGPGYWSKLMDAGIRRSMLSYQEQTLLKQVVQLSSTGNIPVSASGKVPYKTMNMIRSVLSIKEKLESEGISAQMEKTYNIVELFSGIGSQAAALKNLGVKINTVGTSEWDVHAIVAYDMIHGGTDIPADIARMSKDELLKKMSHYTFSNSGKAPLEYEALRTYSVESLRYIYTSIRRNHNFVDISALEGKEMPDGIDILTYSFPCQDLSNVGAFHGYNKGIDKDSGSRSSLLWQVGRVLTEMKDAGKTLPRFLLMENVPTLLSQRHKKNLKHGSVI